MTRHVLALAIAASACASDPAPTPAPVAASAPATTKAVEADAGAASKTLYERLGGKPAIELVVDAFLGNVAQDQRINHRFALADLKSLRGHLVDQVCQATGGPCVYKGLDMKSAHKNMHVTDAEFGAIVEDLIKALDQYHVPEREKGELLGALGGLKPDIVGQ
jgi:hemoglobin